MIQFKNYGDNPPAPGERIFVRWDGWAFENVYRVSDYCVWRGHGDEFPTELFPPADAEWIGMSVLEERAVRVMEGPL